jgi:hypothetical protein
MGPRAGAILLSLMVGSTGVAIGGSAPVRVFAGRQALDRQVRDDMTARGAFAWSESRRLRWADFSGAAPAANGEGALTAYSIFYGVQCTGERFQFLALAGFLPHDSWVRAEVLADKAQSDRTLRHEQTHFDLTEVFARRLRKAFSDLYQPCRRPDGDLDALASQYLRQEKAEQLRYDEETRHGLAAPAQSTWTRQVASDLNALAAYAKQ